MVHAYFEEGSRYFGDYVRAVGWAQKFAAINREVMMKRVIEAAKTVIHKNFRSHKVIDETPAAYKDIDAVMEAQRDLVEVVRTLKQVVCVKG